MKKKLFLGALVLSLGLVTLTGCGGYKAIDKNQSGEVSIMLWSGDGTYREDIGHQNYNTEDLTSQNIAAAYATAKEFNKTYPNIKINIFAKSGDPNAEIPWQQELDNFKAEHGKYPDIYATTDVVGDLEKGMIADLSVFKDDPMYKSFNPSVMKMMNFYGFQAGIPQYLIPWGVYVNRSLAEQNNLDVPDPDWTLDEYTNYISQADGKTFWGDMDVNLSFIATGSKSFMNMMSTYNGEGDAINLNGDDIKDLVSYIPKWADKTIWPQNDLGNLPDGFVDEHWSWGYKFFLENKLLAYAGDPWMMGDAAHPDPAFGNKVKADDWDIYPRPSTDYQPNTVGVVLDPMVIYNYAMNDGDPAMSDSEMEQVKLAYTFASYWIGSTEAFQARADQPYMLDGVPVTSLNDSFPVVTGEEFNKQMDIWYSVEKHQRFKDTAKMPGFKKVLEIWESGQFWDISDKSYPYRHDFEGTRRVNQFEWENLYNPDITGARRTDSNFVDVLKSRLPDWNVAINERYRDSFASLKQSLIKYYGFTEDKLK